MTPTAAGADDVAERAIATYRALLHRYHGTLDLMSDRGLGKLDSMLGDAAAYAEIVQVFVPHGLVLDLGSGAGLPAVVIAASVPNRPMVWVERRRRRAAFLEMVVAGCGFETVTVFGRDVGAVGLDELVGGTAVGVTAQGVGGWAQLYRSTRHLVGSDVTLIARRGETWEEEVRAFTTHVAADVEVCRAVRLAGGGTLVALRVRGG
ncbi:hypothetical protein BH23DEI1_BH23DEI1_19340 [soil metagenome]